jgi:hypothetical protein
VGESDEDHRIGVMVCRNVALSFEFLVSSFEFGGAEHFLNNVFLYSELDGGRMG